MASPAGYDSVRTQTTTLTTPGRFTEPTSPASKARESAQIHIDTDNLATPSNPSMPNSTRAIPSLLARLGTSDQTEAVVELRSILERLQMKKGQAVLIPSPSANPIQAASVTVAHHTFLEKIPLEIRIKIYEFALVNPFLSVPEAIHPHRSQFGATVQYNLSPAILRTCKQIHDEVLYGKNIFAVSGLGDTWDYSR